MASIASAPSDETLAVIVGAPPISFRPSSITTIVMARPRPTGAMDARALGSACLLSVSAAISAVSP